LKEARHSLLERFDCLGICQWSQHGLQGWKIEQGMVSRPGEQVFLRCRQCKWSSPCFGGDPNMEV
jgi:hypothetical protein